VSARSSRGDPDHSILRWRDRTPIASGYPCRPGPEASTLALTLFRPCFEIAACERAPGVSSLIGRLDLIRSSSAAASAAVVRLPRVRLPLPAHWIIRFAMCRRYRCLSPPADKISHARSSATSILARVRGSKLSEIIPLSTTLISFLASNGPLFERRCMAALNPGLVRSSGAAIVSVISSLININPTTPPTVRSLPRYGK
jgi:hypothetical protein